MAADIVRVELIVDPVDGDRERAEEDLGLLLDELSQIDVEKIEREMAGPAPSGTRGDGVNAAGALLIALGSSGATLPALLGMVRDWLNRRGSGAVRMKIGSDEVELTRVDSPMQQRVLEEFLSRHQG
jgi:hypothetical protein